MSGTRTLRRPRAHAIPFVSATTSLSLEGSVLTCVLLLGLLPLGLVRPLGALQVPPRPTGPTQPVATPTCVG